MSVDRQITWQSGKPCPHADLEEVRSADGSALYGERCPACHATWGRGACTGCSRADARLTIADAQGRFCNADCQDIRRRERVKEARAEAKEREATAKRNGVPLLCEHKRTEDVLSGGGQLVGVRCLGCRRVLPASARLGGERR